MSVVSSGRELASLLETLHTDVASIESALSILTSDVRERPADFEYGDGISLLTLKNDVLLDYIHHLVLLSACKVSGRSLTEPNPSALVHNLVKLRLVLEKVRPMESRLKYQVDKLLHAADDADHDVRLGRKPAHIGKHGDDDDEQDEQDEDEEEEEEETDLLAFRPNPNAFMDDKARPDAVSRSRPSKRKGGASASDDEDDEDEAGGTAVYRPPKLAPVAYDPDGPSRRGGKERGPVPTRNSALLADLKSGLSSNPYEMSSAGVGVGGRVSAQNSARARALQRMDEYEEDNFTRLVMSKRDAKKRRRDEADVALGGAGLSSGRDGQRRIGGGVEEEFGDLLRTASGKGNKGRRSEATYDSLRATARTPGSIQRARNSDPAASSPAQASKTDRFKKQMRRAK